MTVCVYDRLRFGCFAFVAVYPLHDISSSVSEFQEFPSVGFSDWLNFAVKRFFGELRFGKMGIREMA
jgi:hypothetical protein